MVDVVYRIVEHDGGWAYKAGDVFSETFPTREAARATADAVAAEQRVPGDDEVISWEDETGRWHDETELGNNRPHVYVEAGSFDARGSTARDMPVASPVRSRALSDTGLYPLAVLAGAAAAGYMLGTMFHRQK